MRIDPGACAFLWIGALVPIFFIPLLLVAARTTPGYGQVSSTFSDASSQGAPHPEFIILGLVLVSAAMALNGIGLARALPKCGKHVQFIQTLAAVSVLLTALFRDYNRSPGVPRNTEGLLHNTFATTAVFSILLTILSIAMAVRSEAGWSHLCAPGLAAFVIVALAGLAFTWGPDSHDGLAERILAGTAFSYLMWVSFHALQRLRGASMRDAWFQQRIQTGQPSVVPAILED